MEILIKKPYEISLWDDILVFKVTYKDKNTNEVVEEREYIGSLDDFVEIENTITEIIQYYKERKICIIGSDIMDTAIRAIQPKIVSNVNGSNTLTFSLYSRYYNEENDLFEDNPFLGLLVNERKIKLRYGDLNSSDCKWYDFIIKEIVENSDTKTFQYTCKDLFINELSKSGFDIQLDQELENNIGNITSLATVVLDESDWKLGNNNDLIVQTIQEPLYKILVKDGFIGINMQTNKTISVEANQFIYGFYSVISNEEEYFQFLYNIDNNYKIDDDHVIINSSNYYIDNIKYTDGIPNFASSMAISSEYQGNKLVRQPQTRFDSTINKYVNVYKKDGIEYYGYTESEYITPTAVTNFITNSAGFTSDTGWETGGYINNNKTVYPSLKLQGFPDIRDVDPEEISNIENFRSFLSFKRTNNNQFLYNSGFSDSCSAIKTLSINDEFIMRIKFYEPEIDKTTGRPISINNSLETINFEIGKYKLENGVYTIEESYFNGSLTMSGEWATAKTKSKVSKSYTDLINTKIGIFLKTPLNKEIYIENVQFYRYITYERLKPDSETEYEIVVAEPGSELFGTTKTKYIYYLPDPNYQSSDDVIPAYEGYEKNPEYIQQFNDNTFEKIRSITVTESNRFNIIQDLCEIFECWAQFEIEHNQQTGEILLDENYRQKKWITFHEYIGKDNYSGFKYGINLKSIQRTLNSNGIVSKIIVKNNANEFAPNGFCSIARASENPIGENFIYSFDYYIQQGLVNFNEINNDLYLDANGYIGYYKNLKILNSKRDSKIEEQTKLLTDISKYESQYQVYKISTEEAEKDLRDTEQYIINLTGYDYIELKRVANKKENGELLSQEEQKAYDWWNNNTLIEQIGKIAQLKSTINTHSKLRDEYKLVDKNGYEIGGKLVEAQKRFNEIETELEELATLKRTLNLKFYKKYSRFIQEGSWISEDYIDENLYYFDAKSTLHTSAQPKVTYTINLLELSQLEEYENYTFQLGDKTFIEDTEFFGWLWIDGVQTPYHEEIIVSEISIELDEPEKNTIKVQNFKTQFEDLFQRITATTQSVEYHTGEYDRVANVVETNGNIAPSTLENSLANNSIKLENAKDQSVVWGSTGIITTNLSNPSEVLRIISGGIFMSIDGGITWNTGITGAGMNASFLTTGQINTSSVNIMCGNFPSFRWDEKGLSAFEFSINSQTGMAQGFNTSKFIRYDQYGLYGIDGYSNFDPTILENDKIGEEKIWNNAKFALTWKGFMLKNKYDKGFVSIDSINDFIVSDGNVHRIKIGNLGNSNSPIYGIRIKDSIGTTVMETKDDGTLWLEDKLNIGTLDSKHKVKIGNLGNSNSDIHGNQVINSNEKFIVYEDGYINATGGRFEGEIYATGGKIGNMTIEQVESSSRKIIITSNGTYFDKTTVSINLQAHIYDFNNQEISDYTGYNFIWDKYDKNGNITTNWKTGREISVYNSDVDSQGRFVVRVEKEEGN